MGRTDAELIAACRAGDASAFGQIVARYQRAVVAVAYAAVRDRVLAEDIAQDAFVTAWTKMSALRDAERLPAWLCGIARNVARARRRTLRREEPGEVDVAGELTPYAQLDDAEREAAVSAALARVPEAYREPLVLFYCEQQSAGEVARALGVSDAAVHQRLSRGRAMLAGDAQLVEHAPSRGRRDLAAAVLAAIGIGIGSSRVEASPRPRGTMLKLAALALVSTLAAGTTYVVATGHSSSAAPPAVTAPAPAEHSARPARAAGLARLASALAAVPNGVHAAAAAPTLDCATTAHHVAEIALAGQAATEDPASMAQFVDEVARHFTLGCQMQHWSPEYMACVLGASDSVSMGFDCAPYASGDHLLAFSDDEVKAGNGPTVIGSRKDPVPPTSDTSCAGVAAHMTELTKPDPASVAALPDGQRQMIEKGIAQAQAQMPAQVEKGCVDAGWTEARRQCLAAATTVQESQACE